MPVLPPVSTVSAVPDLLDPRVRLHVVTGKGGTGKTTVAGALALALARQGRRVLLCEVEGRQGLARLFDRGPLGFEPTSLVPVPGGELLGSAVDAKGALLEYLEVFYRLGRAGRTLERIGAVDFATTIAPGLRDVLLTGKVYDAVRTRQGSRRGDTPYLYDHVVLDAPPTGRIGSFLNVNAVGAGLAKVGPIHSQAESVMKVLRSSTTAVHLVTLLEDMPVQETADAVAELRGLGLPLGRLVVNQVRPPLLAPDHLRRVLHQPVAPDGPGADGPGAAGPGADGGWDLGALAEDLVALGVGGKDPAVRAAALVGQAREHALRVGREDELRDEVAALGLPVVELPAAGGRSLRPGRRRRARARRGARVSPRARRGAGPRLDVDALLDDRSLRVVVCCGSGGVGKTTVAAALALRGAERGRRTVVLTIDPARRLAQSLGLTELDNTPRPVAGVDAAAGGSLDAMMLDMKRTFDEVVEAHATPEKAAQMLANPFYQALSSSFAGTQEYMAMEKLGQLRAVVDDDGGERWDLIVVDTPPSRSALDFLDAPERLGSFLDGRFIRLLLAPAKAGGRAYVRVLSSIAGGVTGVMNRILGAQVLSDVQSFVAAFDTMFGGFRERAQQTYALLAGAGTGFVVVAAPEPDAVREAGFFVDRLQAEGMPLAGVVVNRATTSTEAALDCEAAVAAAEAAEAREDDDGTAGLLWVHARRVRRLEAEREVAARLTRLVPPVPTVVTPARPLDVSDLGALREIGEDLARGPVVEPRTGTR